MVRLDRFASYTERSLTKVVTSVAITRAQALLIVIGDPTVLAMDPLWRSFLNFVHNNGGWEGVVCD